MSQDNIKSAIEAMFFSSDRPLNLEQIKFALGGYQTADIRKLIEEIQTEYESNNRGLRLVEIAGGFQMITAPAFAPFIRKLFKGKRTEKLSKPALETLAIIAYKQPLTKLEIELLRNVNVDGVIASLLEKELIRVAGRKKTPGRPLVFGTTRRFLEYFGLKSLNELPKMEDFSKMNASLGQDDQQIEIEPIEEQGTNQNPINDNQEKERANESEKIAP
ncbi:MAG: SMC-Scp complex subunit ScpB [Candidatus Omnitrophica bacterium]|nr:SMC-Scp complex subunit ScpB [Candidatus Omnitrophota bacterium]